MLSLVPGQQLITQQLPSGMMLYLTPSGFREQLVSGEQKFADLASTESDCNSSKKGGDLGPFGKGSMQS